MPLSLIIFLIVFVIGLIAVPAVAVTAREDRSASVLATVGVFSLLGVLLLFNASATIVPTRSVGVKTAFGKPTGVLRNGFHLVAPWEKVEKFDTSVKTIVMRGKDKGDDVDAPCVTVRLGNQTTACVDVNRAQWNINPDGDVVELYRRYKSFDRIESNVVIGQITNALVTTLGDFDPLASVSGKAEPTKTTAQLSSDALTAVQTAMRDQVGSGVTVSQLQIFVNYDSTTQAKLNDYAKAIAETRIAQQNQQTATANAASNKALTENGGAYKDPGVQYQNCLNLIRDLATRNQLGQLPATFNCGDPRSAVIVQGGAK